MYVGLYLSVTKERFFIGSRSNNPTDQEDDREGLEIEGLEGEVLERGDWRQMI
jgi:hypothetical protein